MSALQKIKLLNSHAVAQIAEEFETQIAEELGA